MTTYEIREGLGGDILIKIDANGVESFVPMDESNSDYQAYLNPVEHLTEIPTADE